jgi:hypothetical protein
MEQEYIEEKTFDKIDFTQNPLTKGEYESCTFISCDFSNSDLADIIFMECEFENCNLSMAKLNKRPHFAKMGEKYKNEDPDSEEELWIPIKSIKFINLKT